jgi:hypothetical protein
MTAFFIMRRAPAGRSHLRTHRRAALILASRAGARIWLCFLGFAFRNCVRRRDARRTQMPDDRGQRVKAMVHHALFHPTRYVCASEHTSKRAIIGAIQNDRPQAFASKYQDVGM